MTDFVPDYNASAGVWARPIDFNSNAHVASGMMVPLVLGTEFACTQWQLTALDPVTFGTSLIIFAPFASAPAATR
jgi:hypothetical protein